MNRGVTKGKSLDQEMQYIGIRISYDSIYCISIDFLCGLSWEIVFFQPATLNFGLILQAFASLLLIL